MTADRGDVPSDRTTNLVLASASPRRRELLARITDDFRVVTPGVAEEGEGPPAERVRDSAVVKARHVARTHEGVIVGADTLVVVDGNPFGKPRSVEEACEMLRVLSGRTHRVLTGLCVLSTEDGRERTAIEETVVRFRPLSQAEIATYVASGEPMDKAGAYGIQGRGALFVERIEGDFYNVMGLPLCRLSLLLREVGLRV